MNTPASVSPERQVPCFWITCRCRTFVLRPDEVESMKVSMNHEGFTGQYKISEGLIDPIELSHELTRRDIAMISNLL